jgi:hypothetical protein
VTFWCIRQSLRRFKSEIFRQPRTHDAQNTTALIALSSRTKVSNCRQKL